MTLKANDRFENYMDIASPETIGDAEKATNFEENHDSYDDMFDEMLDRADRSSEHHSGEIVDDKKVADDTTPFFNDNGEKKHIVTESKADTNFQYGEGGGTQYFICDASDMKMAGKLIQVDVEHLKYEGDLHPITAIASDHGYTMSIDHRPLKTQETEQLEDTINYDKIGEDTDCADTIDIPLSEEELQYLDRNTLEDEALTSVAVDVKQQQTEDWKQQLSDQESSGGTVFPDGVSNPKELVAGETYYQVAAQGYPRESPYFTDRETVDSCRDPHGKVDVSSLMDKLQIPPKRDDEGNVYKNYILTQYEYNPDDTK